MTKYGPLIGRTSNGLGCFPLYTIHQQQNKFFFSNTTKHISRAGRKGMNIQGVPKKMFISKKGAKLTNEHFFGTQRNEKSLREKQ